MSDQDRSFRPHFTIPAGTLIGRCCGWLPLLNRRWRLPSSTVAAVAVVVMVAAGRVAGVAVVTAAVEPEEEGRAAAMVAVELVAAARAAAELAARAAAELPTRVRPAS